MVEPRAERRRQRPAIVGEVVAAQQRQPADPGIASRRERAREVMVERAPRPLDR